MVEVNAGRQPLTSVVALDRVDELREWHREGDDLVLGAGVTYAELAGSGAGARWCPAWPRPPARSGRRRSATPARSAATSAPRRRPATRCRCWPRSTPTVELRRLDRPPRRCPCAEFCIGPEAHGARRRRADRRRSRVPVLDGPAGVPEGRRPQRHGDRGAPAWRWSSTSTGRRSRSALGSVGPDRRCGHPRPRRGSADRIDWRRRAARRPGRRRRVRRRWWPRRPARSTTTARPPPTAATPSACCARSGPCRRMLP